MKEEIFSKFRDYNRELEKILEKKDFSQDTKNLLLSMFYKLEISYQDYYTVKRKSKTKQEYLENILENIQQCNTIELIKPSDSQFEELKEGNLYEIDFKLKKIKVLSNEFALLSAILELNNFEIRLNEEYNLIRNSIPYLLNTAYDIENLEVLRDFNAWSWNTQVEEIKDIDANLIYQNLKIALNKDIFSQMQEENNYIDVIEMMKENLKNLYPSETIDKMLQLIFKLSILIYIRISDNEKKRLQEEKEIIQLDLEEIKNKKLYIEKIIQERKKLVDDVKHIDLVMNNRDLLTEEYERRNQTLSEYNQIFSISHLVEKMQREKQKLLDKIEQCNQKMEPQHYIQDKNKLQEDDNLLKDICFDKQSVIDKDLKKLQIIFLKEIFLTKIEKATTKSELIDCVYELRYYHFLYYTKEMMIKDVKELGPYLQQVKEKLIKKLYDHKILAVISTNEENDIKIVKSIFELRIINLEDIYIEVKKQDDDRYMIMIYDDKDALETEIEMQLEWNKKDRIKFNKKLKLFI